MKKRLPFHRSLLRDAVLGSIANSSIRPIHVYMDCVDVVSVEAEMEGLRIDLGNMFADMARVLSPSRLWGEVPWMSRGIDT